VALGFSESQPRGLASAFVACRRDGVRLWRFRLEGETKLNAYCGKPFRWSVVRGTPKPHCGENLPNDY